MDNVISLPTKKIVEFADFVSKERRLMEAKLDLNDWLRQWRFFNEINQSEINVLFPNGDHHKFINNMADLVSLKKSIVERMEN